MASKNSVSMMAAFPLLFLSLAAYGAFIFLAAPDRLPQVIVTLPIISGDAVSVTMGDLFVISTVVLLFAEILKAVSTNNAAIANHCLSTAVFVLCTILFLTADGFGNMTFLLMTVFALFDVVAGFVITAVASRRDLSVSPGWI